ncbi:MAG: CHAT domain-containing protein, partial [Bacteroidales bacterium]|nr:CHAT domain-containing protein [Bacteroidales bacterium]
MKRILILVHLISISFLGFNDIIFAQENNTDLAAEYYKKGIDYKYKYKLDSADYYLKQAAALFKKNEDWDNYLIVQNEVGSILLAKNEFDKAISFYQEQLGEAANHFNETNEYSANFYNNLGLAYFFKGNIDAALDIYDRALSIRLALGDRESIFVSNLYNDMGNAYSEKGEYEIAMDYYKNALKIRKKILGDNHPETAASYNNMGIVYEALGQYDLAIENHQKAIKIQKSIFGNDYPELANYYFGLGNVYKDQGDWDMAMDYYMQSFSIHKKNYGETNPLLAKDLIAIGNIYTQQGDNDNAIEALQKALDIQRKTLGANHPDLALTYNNVGNIYNQDGQYDLALSFYFNALDIKKAAIGEEHPEIADYYTNIGNVYAAKGDYQQALDYHQKAIDLKTLFFGKKHPALILPYLNIGNIYYEMHKYNNALKYFQLSLSVNVKDFNPDSSDIYTNPVLDNYYDGKKLLNSLNGKAKTLTGLFVRDSSETDLNAAYATYMKCDSMIDIIRKTTVSKQDKLELGKVSNTIYDQAIDVCAKLHLWFDDPNNDYLKKAFYFSEKNKAGVLLEAIAAAEAQKFAGIPDSLLNIEKNLKNKIAFYETQLGDVYDTEQEADIRTKLFDVKNAYNKLIKSFERDYPKYFEMKYSKRYASVKDIQSTLPQNTALRSYFIGESLISIFTLTRDSIILERSEKPEDFDFKIYGLRHLITSSETEDVKQLPLKSYEFYKILFPKPLPDNINTLLIIQDGNLGLLPFEALLTDIYQGGIINYNNYPFLIKKYAIAYSYSANLYYKNIKRTIN